MYTVTHLYVNYRNFYDTICMYILHAMCTHVTENQVYVYANIQVYIQDTYLYVYDTYTNQYTRVYIYKEDTHTHRTK